MAPALENVLDKVSTLFDKLKALNWENLTAQGVICVVFLWATFHGIPKGLEKVTNMSQAFVIEAKLQRQEFTLQLEKQRNDFREEMRRAREEDHDVAKQIKESVNQLTTAFTQLTEELKQTRDRPAETVIQ